jgi:hypothetical protein
MTMMMPSRTPLLCILFLTAGAIAQAQEPAPAASAAPAAAAAAAAPAGKTVEQTASPELVGKLVSELGITPAQAEGAAGILFGNAKAKLTADEFAKVAAAVPNMDGLLKAAPGAAPAAAPATAPAAAGVSPAPNKTTAALAAFKTAATASSTMSKLGIKPETALKVAPALIKAVQGTGGAQVAALLAGALK